MKSYFAFFNFERHALNEATNTFEISLNGIIFSCSTSYPNLVIIAYFNAKFYIRRKKNKVNSTKTGCTFIAHLFP